MYPMEELCWEEHIFNIKREVGYPPGRYSFDQILSYNIFEQTNLFEVWKIIY